LKTLVTTIVLLYTCPVLYGQLSEASINRLQQIVEEVPGVAKQMDNAATDAQFDQASEKFDNLLIEMERIMDTDPAFKRMYDDMLKELRMQRADAVSDRAQTNKQSQSSGNSAPPQTFQKELHFEGTSHEIRATDQNTTSKSAASQKQTAEQTYATFDAIRQEQGTKRRKLHEAYTDQAITIAASGKHEICTIDARVNVRTTVRQEVTNDPCQFSVMRKVPWSSPTTLPGTRISFQFAPLFYCKVPALTLGDQMKSVMDDYGFVRINNDEDVPVSGRVEVEYLDMNGAKQKGIEGFVLSAKQSSEDIGMWYLACRFVSITLIEFKCN
jgi:hypothetical protein